MTQEELMAWLMQQFQAPPNYTSKGVQKPDSLGYQKDAANWLQDQSQLMGDPMAAVWGGSGSYDPQMYQDVADGFDEFQVPADPLAPYLSLDPTSKEGAVARRIAEGASPEQIAAEAAANGTTDPKELDRVRGLADGLFRDRYQYESTVSTLPGFEQDEGGNWNYRGDGQLVGGKLKVPKFKRSDAAQEFDKMGLPTPDQRFASEDFGGGQWQGADEQAKGLLSQMLQARTSAKQSFVAQQAEDKRVAGFAPEFAAMEARVKDSRLGDGSLTGGGGSQTYASPMGRDNVTGTVQSRGQNLIDWALSDERKAQREWVLPAVKRAAGGSKDSAAYRALTQAATEWRGADQMAQKTTTARKASDAYANKMAALHAQAGLTPLTMVALKRAQALRGMA